MAKSLMLGPLHRQSIRLMPTCGCLSADIGEQLNNDYTMVEPEREAGRGRGNVVVSGGPRKGRIFVGDNR